MREVEEAMKKHEEAQKAGEDLEAARQEMKQSAKRFDRLVAGNLRLRERGARAAEVERF